MRIDPKQTALYKYCELLSDELIALDAHEYSDDAKVAVQEAMLKMSLKYERLGDKIRVVFIRELPIN